MTKTGQSSHRSSEAGLDLERQEVFEQIIAKYEKDWHRSGKVKWEDYLPEDMILRACLIAELPQIEAEFQGRSASAVGQLIADELSTEISETPTQVLHASDVKQNRGFRASVTYENVVGEIRGGLGDVYVIRDVELNRVVVVKQLQARWLGDPRAERAFQREVQITSMLEHPSIVPVHSVGKGSDGRPFYSMRYVEGQTLQQAIDTLHSSGRLDSTALRSLLTHFIQICKTIAFANSRGIVHRDLKPSNIAIGPFGQTLVLDWGLAKEITKECHPAARLEDARADHQVSLESASLRNGSIPSPIAWHDTDHAPEETCRGETAIGDVIGTPAFMSPEQAMGRVQDISHRTDVFGLGAVLYTILFGRPPYVGKNSTETVLLASQGVVDYSVPKTNDAMLRGLVAICKKAMSKGPEERYSDAQSLADDLENWLAGENIAIQKQPWTYRIGRFATQQRTMAFAVGLLLVATIAAIVIGVQMYQAQKTKTLIAANESKANLEVAKKVAEYIAKVFRTADPIRFDDPGFAEKGSTGALANLRAILDRGHELIDGELKDHPETYAELLASLGTSYRGVGEYDQARELLFEALKVHRDVHGDFGYRTLECLYQIARLEYEQGNYEEAEKRFRNITHTVDLALDSLPNELRKAQERDLELLKADAKFQLGWILIYQPLGMTLPQFDPESVASSQELFREVIDVRQQYLAKNDRSIGLAYAGLAASLFCTREKESEAILTAATSMEILNSSNQESSFGSFLLEYNKAEGLRSSGKYDEAEKQYLKLAEFIQKEVGEDHPVMAVHRWNMVGFYRKFQQLDKAEKMITTIRNSLRNLPGVRSSDANLDSLRQYAEALVERNRMLDAIQVYSEILEYAKERPSQNSDLIKNTQATLGKLRASSANQ